jgi:hypothetical protein
VILCLMQLTPSMCGDRLRQPTMRAVVGRTILHILSFTPCKIPRTKVTLLRQSKKNKDADQASLKGRHLVTYNFSLRAWTQLANACTASIARSARKGLCLCGSQLRLRWPIALETVTHYRNAIWPGLARSLTGPTPKRVGKGAHFLIAEQPSDLRNR